MFGDLFGGKEAQDKAKPVIVQETKPDQAKTGIGAAPGIGGPGRRLHWCNICKENSVKIKVYQRKDGTKGRVEFCLNHCNYRKELPYVAYAHSTEEQG